MFPIIVQIQIFHLILIMIIFRVRLIILPANTDLLLKKYNNIDTAILSLLLSNFLLRYLSICGKPGSFSTGIFSTITMVSWFKVRYVLHLFWNLTSSIFFPYTLAPPNIYHFPHPTSYLSFLTDYSIPQAIASLKLINKDTQSTLLYQSPTCLCQTIWNQTPVVLSHNNHFPLIRHDCLPLPKEYYSR